MRSRFFVACAATLLLLIFSGGRAHACSCFSGGPPCQAYGKTEAVFTGTPIDVKTVTAKQTSEGREYEYGQRLFTFRVEEAFRGVTGAQQVQVMTGQGGGDCGYSFQLGVRYLVYAGHGQGGGDALYSSICTRTRKLEDADEDLDYIRSLPKREPGATISGEVSRYRRNLETDQSEQLGPLAGIEIVIASGGNSFTVQTDAAGRFSLKGLAPGNYIIKPLLPEKLSAYDLKQEAYLLERGCANVYFSVTDNGRVDGRVLDEEGKPAPRVMVNLIPVSQAESTNPRGMFNATDDEGRFSLKFVPPGNYLLGIRLNGLGSPDDADRAYPRTYYPGVSLASEAMTITIGEGEALKDLELRLPPRLVQRRISGKVLLADGRPTANANVARYETAYTARGLGYAIAADAEGNFSFTGYEGISYLLTAYVNTERGGQMHAEPVEVPASGPVTNLRLVVSEPNGSCARCRAILSGERRKKQP